jgi:VWFA-related protein
MKMVPVALAIACGFAAHGQQTFRSGVDAVRVDVLVMDGKRPVVGLKASDFELRDSGVVQPIESVAIEDVPLNVMLALDTSESVDGTPLHDLKQAALAVVRLLRPDDRAALITFNEYVTLRAGWTAEIRQLERSINQTKAAGATALHDAAYSSLTLRHTRPGRTLALLFSDGDDTASWLPGATVLDIARRNEVVVYAVEKRGGAWKPGYRIDFHSGLQTGVANVDHRGLDERFLSALAEETGGQYLRAASSGSLRDTFVKIINEFRTRYLLTYTPRGVDAGGWHPLEVKLTRRKGTVTARRGYLK